MDDQRISVETRYIEVLMSNGKQVSGEAFLQLHGAHLAGPQRIGEAINGDEDFLPLRSKHGIELINLKQVISVVTAAEEEFDPLLKLGEEHRIQVEPAVGETLHLRIFVNLPGGKTRVKDFLNQDKRFLLFLHDDKVLYLARNRILCVKD
ncbi:MAG: hypothetical protein JXQ81_09425 [Desulfuromonadales bacterium]|nr:hypothetical protein [Desulfuromonadales bacterium]MBN2792713.1 hypothetical protein [Desulfuromonadales bacterium]